MANEIDEKYCLLCGMIVPVHDHFNRFGHTQYGKDGLYLYKGKQPLTPADPPAPASQEPPLGDLGDVEKQLNEDK